VSIFPFKIELEAVGASLLPVKDYKEENGDLEKKIWAPLFRTTNCLVTITKLD